MVDWDTLVMKILPGIEIENEMTRKIFNVNVGTVYIPPPPPPPLSNLGQSVVV